MAKEDEAVVAVQTVVTRDPVVDLNTDRIERVEEAVITLNHFSGWARGKIETMEKIGVALAIEGIIGMALFLIFKLIES